jgi:hypothetical protein
MPEEAQAVVPKVEEQAVLIQRPVYLDPVPGGQSSSFHLCERQIASLVEVVAWVRFLVREAVWARRFLLTGWVCRI